MLTYEDLQFLGLRSMLRTGEMLHLPVMLSGPGRKIRLAVQDVRPDRLRTPLDKRHDPSIVDGVQLDAHGTPVAYWLSTPGPALSRVPGMSGLASDQFTRVPARVGHRPGIFHLFRHNEEEQVRGESVLNPGMNLFRHLADALDNELLAAVTQAALAVFISRDTSGTALPGYVHEADDSDGGKGEHYHEAVLAGTVMYGNENEKPHMLETSRPSPNFAVFCEFVLRAMAASLEIPYIVLCKDFSKVNYSSARAALIEAWRVYLFWRSMMVSHYCRPIWSMVIEEAWLAGHLRLPAGAPDFYDAVSLYTRAIWIGPSRGYVEPKKEIEATVLALGNRLMTYSEAIAERGRDFDDVMDEREEEEARLAKLPQPPMQQSGKKPAAPDAPEEGEDSDASE